MKYFVMSMLAVAVLAVSVSAQTQVLWEEDFESYADATVTSTTVKWAGSPDEGLMIRGYNEDSAEGQRVDPDGMALDGNSHKEQGVTGRKWAVSRAVGVPGPSANATEYKIEFDANVSRGHNSNGTANSGLYLECGDSAVCGEFGIHFSRANGKGWGFINSGSGLANVGEYDNHAWGSGTAAVSIILDKATMQATATVGGNSFAPQTFSQNVWDNLNGFRIRNDIAGVAHHDANTGMDVDNIRVSQTIPEPATMGLALLALCGLAVIRRKR